MDEESKLRNLIPVASHDSIAIRPVILVEKNAILNLPLRHTGGDLGLGDGGEPWIHFKDACGKRFLTHSVEWLLKNIDSFAEGRDRDQALAGAAVHYGFDAHALLGRAQPCNRRTSPDEIQLAKGETTATVRRPLTALRLVRLLKMRPIQTVRTYAKIKHNKKSPFKGAF